MLRSVKEAITFGSYEKDTERAQIVVKEQTPLLEAVEARLGDREWYEGETPSVADLMLMELTDQLQQITDGEWLKSHAGLASHNARTRAIP